MVECLLWEQDAAGSSPVASTIESAVTERLLLFVPASKAGSPALGIVAEARPVDDEARRQWRSGQNRSALQAEMRFWEPQEAAKPRMPQVQGLGSRLGRCFCAVHRGVHRTPAPCRLDHRISSN